MKDGVLIAWNPANMITVVLMATLFFSTLAFAARFYQTRQLAQAA